MPAPATRPALPPRTASPSAPIAKPQSKVAFGPIQDAAGHRIVLYGPGGIGKAQPLDAKVLTPTGFKPMGEIVVGDAVIGSNGQPCRVLGVYPQGEKDVFRVVFRDGSTTECCDDHLWHTRTVTERGQGLPGAVRPLASIRRTLRYGREFNHHVPRVKPVHFASQHEPLPVAPWLLGVYLGDGSSQGGSVNIHNPEQDIQELVSSSVADSDVCVANGDIGLRVKRRLRVHHQGSDLKAALCELGLYGKHSYDKFIPRQYLFASVCERLELLRGLCDTDGHVTNPGSIEYSTSSDQLGQDFCFLVRSLGGSTKCMVKEPSFTYRGEKKRGRIAYRIFASFPKDVVPVSSAKHLGRWAAPRWAIRHSIRSVEPIGRKPCQCIQVEALDGLYVTDDFIVTHNTSVAASAPGPVAFFDFDDSLPRLKPQLHASGLGLDLRPVTGVSTWAQMREALHAPGWDEIKTIVIDSATKAEELAAEYTVATVPHEKGNRVQRIEDYGFGKGYVHVYDTFLTLLGDLDQHTRAGRNVVMICHDCTSNVPNPDGEDWIRYEPRLQSPASGKSSIRLRVREWADHVLFVGYDVAVKDRKGKGSGTRTIYPSELPHCMAKSRTISEPMPLTKYDQT